jgi:hypothetical protein
VLALVAGGALDPNVPAAGEYLTTLGR